ncbi:enoyl-CoA hydratase/isomerase family protein [Rhodococcoides kyotonense]|uniref:Enoyl-CoA hydratase/carnithine racemase n=1 Tax=Rhodococcoides kyotonense TaxID=398843 RepID=A0A239ISI8_9NOCA|nr:enoyl-CoA hydratase/isomerase family protein [Rhodococcus kyotonensis]SNS96505.1 Enoyl-CoA hydratase/carnithine racemase [Rhodococcus kyotonensis]
MTTLILEEQAPGLIRVTIDNPPINLFDPHLYAALNLLLDRMENDENLRVVVIDSADSDYFVSHLDVDRLDEVPDIPGAASLPRTWPTFVRRFASAPVVTIASIRGRARGIGSEFALACDMRFASLETARLGQPEVGFGVVPGGGGLDWLPRIVGRSRALEIVLGADDFDAATAERYGWINRAIADDRLDDEVTALAERIAGFPRHAIASAKRIVDDRSIVPTTDELAQSFSAIGEAIAHPEARRRMASMESAGWGRATNAERDHPALLVQLANGGDAR